MIKYIFICISNYIILGLSQQQSKNYDRDFLLSFTSKPASIKMSANLEKVLKELDLERKVTTETSTKSKDGGAIDLVAPIRTQRVFDPSTGNWTDAVTYINEHSRA